MLPTWTKTEKEAFQRARDRADREQAHNQRWRDYMYNLSVAELATHIFANGFTEFTPEQSVEKAKEIMTICGITEPFQMERTHDDDLKCC